MLVDTTNAVKQRLFMPPELELEMFTLARVLSLLMTCRLPHVLEPLLQCDFEQQRTNLIWKSASKLID